MGRRKIGRPGEFFSSRRREAVYRTISTSPQGDRSMISIPPEDAARLEPYLPYGLVLPDDAGAPERAEGACKRMLLGNEIAPGQKVPLDAIRSEEHTYELQSLMRNSSAVFCLNKKKKRKT